jgi:hypothetical protein
MNFILLTETDYNEYIKLKEQNKRINNYHRKYIKNKFEDAKKKNPEKYKLMINEQVKHNNKYKKDVLEKLKEDPIKYNEYRLKINEYNRSYRNKRKQKLINSIVAT